MYNDQKRQDIAIDLIRSAGVNGSQRRVAKKNRFKSGQSCCTNIKPISVKQIILQYFSAMVDFVLPAISAPGFDVLLPQVSDWGNPSLKLV